MSNYFNYCSFKCAESFLLGFNSCGCEKVVGEVPSLSNSYKSFINKGSLYRSSRKHLFAP